ncbi:MAG TPA: NAD(P)-binding domain-containing protein [Streptosporangiaceae bacterium]|nr:NAD(P)-binding domain-containing protein [Streptosporangiaceae bacterium]
MTRHYDLGDAAGPGIPAEHFDTVIVGGGQAGLSVGYHLARLGRSFVILDEHQRTGDGWRERYDSLRLYSPAKYDGLPGMPFPAPPYSFPSGRQMADYLQAYAAQMGLPLAAGVKVDGLRPGGGAAGSYVLTAGERRFAAAQVVVATGAQQVPSAPSFAGQLDPGIRQLHSSDYRNPAQLLPGGVLVVGASHSGADIALEAAQEHKTWLSGPVHGQIPFDIEGRPARQIMRLLWFAANHILTVKTPLGRKMRPLVRGHGGPLLRVKLPHLSAVGVEYVSARTTGVRDGLPRLADGRALDVTNVIWCTGFRPDFSWIHLPVIGDDGWPRQDRGVASGTPGLYFAGVLFQYAFSSMLVGGAGRDARYVARHIAKHRPDTAHTSRQQAHRAGTSTPSLTKASRDHASA